MPNDDQQTPDPQAQEPPADNGEQPGGTGEPDKDAEIAKWKALARKHEQQSKANADKAKRFDELEEASKTELQKAVERAEKAEKALAERAAAEEAGKLRKSVADAKGVPADLLSGSTQEELEASADALLAFKGTTPKAPSPTGQGNAGAPVHGTDKTPEQIVAEATKR